MLTLLVSIISGGLAGGIVSAISNRIFHWRALRTQFYPKLSNMYSAYIIRFEKPNGRYWVNIVGQNPSNEDEEFVEHRSIFISELVALRQFIERDAGRHLLPLTDRAPGRTPRNEMFDLTIVSK